MLTQFARLRPCLEITLFSSDAGVENMLDGCDVVPSFGLPGDEGMVARKVASSDVEVTGTLGSADGAMLRAVERGQPRVMVISSVV
ncbi:LysR family transcriptional regulator [Pandoraea anapnoica]|uniref:LysR family transcriptional regulator n=1 Tax=Pandoraea anapnoica TaxID=2508301 RepID=A0A5E5AQG1_9BURK|nr:LysR family transcriptional regulator [Pandoraea anapnoica]